MWQILIYLNWPVTSMAIVSLSSVFLRISSASSADPSKMVFNPFNVATSRCIEVTCEGEVKISQIWAI